MSYQPSYQNYGWNTNPYYGTPSPYQNNIPMPSPYQNNIPMPQYTPMTNQTPQQPQFIPVQIHGHTIKDENTEIAPNDVPMDGTISLFPTENYSCIFAKHWNKDGKITTTKFVPVPIDEDYVPTPGFEDEMRTRMDELKTLIQQNRNYNKKSNYNRNKLNGLEQGLSQLGYADLQQFSNLSNGLCQLGYQTQAAVNDVSRQLSECCCDTREAIQGVNYNIAQGFANQGFQLQQCCCDLKETMNNNTRAITDQLTQFRMEDKNEQIAELRSQVQALNLAQSQANQNNYLIGQLRPSPVPAYTVANPYAGFGYGCCGTAQTCCC